LILVVRGPALLPTVYHRPTWRNLHGRIQITDMRP
jgi:hypothetical protein